jgi:hypothetical protein
MTIGSSLLLIAVGAILKWAVTAHVTGLNLQNMGVILIVVGVIGLALGLYLSFVRAGPPVRAPGRIRRWRAPCPGAGDYDRLRHRAP